VFSNSVERVLSKVLFHAEVAEAAKARPPIIACQTLVMTRSMVDDDGSR